MRRTSFSAASFPFSPLPGGGLPPLQGGKAAVKPMQWPNGAEVEEDDWEFFPEAIKSWRAWRVVNWQWNPEELGDNRVLMLQSITYRTMWTPKQEMIAECKPLKLVPEFPTKSLNNAHACPDLNHGCGIYSVKTEAQALEWKNYRVHDPVVWGQVNIWGHVYKFTKGYLSEFAYPARIYVPDDLGAWNHRISPEMVALELTDIYGVEAVTI